MTQKKIKHDLTVLGGKWKHGSFFGTGLTPGKENEESLDNPGGGGRVPVILHGMDPKRKTHEYKKRRLGAYASNLKNRSANQDNSKYG